MKRFVLVALLFLSIFCSAQVPVAIRTEGTKARKTPSADAPVAATLHKGEIFVVTDDRPYWYEITLRNGKSAWVRKSACTIRDTNEDTPDEESPITTTTPPPSGGDTSVAGCSERTIPVNWSVCPASGTGGIYGDAYVQKNRFTIPCTYKQMSVDDVLALQHLSRSARGLPDGDPQSQYLKTTESRTVVVEGYLAMAKDGGAEGVNCKSTSRIDTHLELVDTDSVDPVTNRSQHIVAEVTPWFRAAIPEWTTDAIGEYASYVGGYSAGVQKQRPTKIRVYGYLFFDEAHATGAQAWRGTAWEVHPITRIEVLKDGQWVEFGQIH